MYRVQRHSLLALRSVSTSRPKGTLLPLVSWTPRWLGFAGLSLFSKTEGERAAQIRVSGVVFSFLCCFCCAPLPLRACAMAFLPFAGQGVMPPNKSTVFYFSNSELALVASLRAILVALEMVACNLRTPHATHSPNEFTIPGTKTASTHD